MRPEDLAVLAAALENLQEAARRTRQLKAKAKLERQLEKAMQVAFRAQGKALAKRFKAWKERFPVSEAVGPEGWGDLWALIASETFKRFEVPIRRAIRQAFKAGAAAANTPGSGISFDLKNPRAEAWLKDRAAARVAMIDETTRDTIGGLVNKGISEGWSYDRVAREISDRFDAFAVGKPQKHIDSRAHLVAVTEVGEAYAEGNLQMGEQLQAAGLTMEKSWLTAADDRVSAGCRDNAAAGWIPLEDDFPSGHKRPLRFPGCRCDILIQRKKGGESRGGKQQKKGLPRGKQSQATKPAGIAVSKALEVDPGPRTKVGAAARRTIEVIDQVHGDGTLPRIPLITERLQSGVYGGFAHDEGLRVAQGIVIAPRAAQAEMTIAHEIGHFLDHSGLGGGVFASDVAPELAAFRRAIDGSDAIKRIKAIAKVGYFDHTSASGKVIRYRLPPDGSEYLLRYRECWARAYAQYLATKSQNAILLTQLEEMRDPLTPESFSQWSDQDFEPIFAAIEAVLEAKGWMTRSK